MPTLPTLTVTQAQADRLIAVFGSVDAYKIWLKQTLVEYVVRVESSKAMRDFTLAQEQTDSQKRAQLLDGAS